MRRVLLSKTLIASILLIIFLLFVGKFFYAQAQTITPDIVLEMVSLSGDAAVVYRNDGAAISGQSYIVSFQWVDASGAGLAPKQTLTRNTLAAQGRDVLLWNTTAVEGVVMMREQRCYQTGSFFRRRTQCDNIEVPRAVSQTLAAYRAARPRQDALLAVTLDDGNRITESNEGNNSAQVGNTPFRAAPPTPPAEIVLTRATFDGVYLFVVFQNQSAVNIIDKPFDVGLQWLDKNGSALSERRFFRYKNLASGKVEVIDSKNTLFTLSQTGPGLNDIATAEPLPLYLLRRPINAAKLSITVDDRNQITEVTKANNVAVIDLPNPDLLILDQKLTPQELSFKYVNAGAAPLIGSSPLSFWFEWVDAKGTRVGDHLYWLNRDTVSLRQNVPVSFTSNGIAVYSSRGMFILNQILQNPPAEASALKITIDGPNVFSEFSETNNSVVLSKPIVPLPDLNITKQVQILNPQRLVFSYINASVVPLTQFPAFSFWFEWVDEKGARVGNLYWQDRGVSTALPGVTNIFNSAGVYVYVSSGGFASLDSLLRDPPATATHLKITIDGPNKFRETDENKNVALLSKPAVPLPDVSLRDAARTPSVIKMTIVNSGKAEVSAPEWEFRWIGADGKVLGAPQRVTYSIAWPKPDASAPFEIPYMQGREDAVNRMLKNPPAGSTALEIILDPDNKIQETDEKNNSTRIEMSSQADFVLGAVGVKDGAMQIEVKNQGTKDAPATDIWLMWFGAKGALPSSGAVDLPAIAAGASTTVSIPFDGKTEASAILREPPKDGTRVRIYVDGSRKVEESNEQNNDVLLDRAVLSLALAENKPPIADAGEDIVERDDDNNGIEVVRFYSRNSSDSDGKIVSWTWTLNGKEIADGQYPYWRNAPIGTHNVTLTVKDDKGATATDQVIVKIEGPPASPPDLVIDSLIIEPAQPKPGDTVFFTVRTVNRGQASAGSVSSLYLDIDLENNKSIDIRLAQPVLKNLAPNEEQSWHWNDANDQYYHWKAKEGTHLIRACADAAGAIKELDESNNCLEKVITVGTSVVKPPELNLALSVETILSSSAAGAAANSVATGGLFLALLTFLGGGLLIYAHNGTPGTARDLFGVFPLVFASPEISYMRLQECGPEGCRGKHFARHRVLKYVTKGSLVAAVSAGALKLVIVTALATLLPASQTLLAEGKEVYPGDKLRAILVVKNVGQSKATDLVLTLPCPTGTFWASTALNNKDDKRNAASGIPAADLDVDKSHQLAVVCQVKDIAATSQQKLKFVGTASAKGVESVFQSNAVELQARPRPEPEKPLEPELLPDLSVEGLGIVSENVVGGASQPFKATFTGIVKNKGDKPAALVRARLRVDIGANGTWDNLGAGLFDVPALNQDSTAVAKWDIEWKAPLGLYVFEVCVDTDNKVQELNEKNNCLTDRFTLQKGEEPMFEESEDLVE